MPYQSRESVQMFLDGLAPMEPFAVIFHKADGFTQRVLVGNLDPNATSRKENVPMMTDEGWKSFNLNRVLWIGFPDQFESINQMQMETD